jgi:hypothetical protein
MSKSVAGVTGNFEALGDMDFSWRWMVAKCTRQGNYSNSYETL